MITGARELTLRFVETSVHVGMRRGMRFCSEVRKDLFEFVCRLVGAKLLVKVFVCVCVSV